MVRGIGWALLGVLALHFAAAQAQPAQNGNVYNGTAHEPNPSATQQQEQSAGVGLSQQQQQQQTNTVEQLDKQLQNTAKTPEGTRAGCSANGKSCPP